MHGKDDPIKAHGGYRDLKSFQMSEIVFDATVKFCERFVDRFSRTTDQMVQAARSGRQNIAEGSQASGTSSKTELKLVSVARASLEELLLDYEDFLRQRELKLWAKDSKEALFVRKLSKESDRSYTTYKPYLETRPAETCANIIICWINSSRRSKPSSSKRAASASGCITAAGKTGAVKPTFLTGCGASGGAARRRPKGAGPRRGGRFIRLEPNLDKFPAYH